MSRRSGARHRNGVFVFLAKSVFILWIFAEDSEVRQGKDGGMRAALYARTLKEVGGGRQGESKPNR